MEVVLEALPSRLRTIQHRSHAGVWRLDVLRPTPALAPFVRRFNAYAEHDTAFARRRELPNGLATILFNLGDELRIEHPQATRTVFGRGTAFFAGLSARFAVSETDHAQQGVQVMLTPAGARRLLGMPLSEAGSRLIDPADVFGAAFRETLDRIQQANTHQRRLELLERMIADRLARAETGPPADIEWALARLQASRGRVQVARLAEAVGCSRKHLTVRFSREFGLPPKVMARVLRFDHAVQRMRHGDVASWADLAAVCGYADQSHLGREFRALSGDTPLALMRRALPDDAGFSV